MKINQNANRVCRLSTVLRKASLTVECAAVLPIYFIAVVTLVMFMDAVRTQGEANLKLSNTAREMAVAAGLSGSGSDADGHWIDLMVVKTYRYPVTFPGIPSLKMLTRARVYPWIGSSDGLNDGTGGGSGNAGEVIYVTDYESVYHTDPSCTHVDLEIFKSSTSQIGSLRNEYGRRYKKCEGFPEGYSGPVYAAAKGDYYYPSTDYPGLTRHVHMTVMEGHEDLRPCSRCAAHG